MRLLLWLTGNVLLLVASLLAMRITLTALGQPAATPWLGEIMESTSVLVPRLGLASIATPYRGILDLNAGVALGAVCGCEWITAISRRFVR